MLHKFKVFQRPANVPELGLLDIVEAIFGDDNRTDHTLFRTEGPKTIP